VVYLLFAASSCCVVLLLLVVLVNWAIQSWPGGSQIVTFNPFQTARSHAVPATYCLQRLAGEPLHTSYTSSSLPAGEHSVFVDFLTHKSDQVILAWGDSQQLRLDSEGLAEYNSVSLQTKQQFNLTQSTAQNNLADGNWHSIVVTKTSDGRGTLYVDGFHAGHGSLAIVETSHSLNPLAFDGSIESARIIKGKLDSEHIGFMRSNPCVFASTTSTVTTTTKTTTTTTITTSTSTHTSTTTAYHVVLVGTTETVTTTSTITTTTKTVTGTSTTSTTTVTKTTTSTKTSTTTRSSTSTSTTITATKTTTSTWTKTVTALPQPYFSSPGELGTNGALKFEGATLPASDKDLTIVVGFEGERTGDVQVLASWGVGDVSRGCVSLFLDSDGRVAYRELPPGGATWTRLEGDGSSFLDGRPHVVVLSRSAAGVAYLYVDGHLQADSFFENSRPSWGLPHQAEAAVTCGDSEWKESHRGQSKVAPSGLLFQGSSPGIRLYDRALDWRQIETLTLPDSGLVGPRALEPLRPGTGLGPRGQSSKEGDKEKERLRSSGKGEGEGSRSAASSSITVSGLTNHVLESTNEQPHYI